jgi:plastocyanin domain-containing protein
MILINLLGLFLIVLIVWWFWIYKSKEVTVSEGAVTVTVENGSDEPSRIRLPAGEIDEDNTL